MTKKVNPWISGTLPRGRHLVYQGILVALWIIAYAIEPKSAVPVSFATGAASWFFEVKRLHDAGYNGGWAIPVMALGVVVIILSDMHHLNDDESAALVLAWIANLAGFIVICALPTKKDDNPYA